MPVKSQIATIKRILSRANPLLDDPEILPLAPGEDAEWIDDLDENFTLSENISNLEKLYPGFRWRVPRHKPLSPNKPIRYLEKDTNAGPRGDSFSLKVRYIVQSHKVTAKGKTYELGRIQLTVDKELIGKEAEIYVIVHDWRSSRWPQRK